MLVPSAEIMLVLMPLAGVTAFLLARQQQRIARQGRDVDMLQRAARDMQALLDHAPLGFAVFDRQLCYVRINRMLADINGLSAEEHFGKQLRDVVPEIAAATEISLQQVLRTGQPMVGLMFEGSAAAQPGTRRTFRESMHPLFGSDGGLLGVSVTTEDITEQTRLANALRDSEARERRRAAELESVLETTPASIFIATDRACRHVRANGMGRRMLRLQPAESPSLSGPGMRAFDVVIDGRPAAVDELPMQRAAASGEESWGRRLSIRFAPDDLLHVVVNATPLRDETGKVTGATCTVVEACEHPVCSNELAHVHV